MNGIEFDIEAIVTTSCGVEEADERYYILAEQQSQWRLSAYGNIQPDGKYLHDGNGQNQGAYAGAAFVSRRQINGKLRPLADIDEDPLDC
ncbi:hypothetical protein FEM03_01365 [Phragmitibacter flavus]|uniref:Uncharacterized protein n=1 Tax=Phragmitibacter flavus TaxID=2576071 RepID=A0A5R8KKK3_9BACT|nr:hypothetical protein [Phragmitibacter flavus]TLD72751.1 hypothetical protein FEM03_01365 [Phragmitibacter flavus]